MSSKYAIGIYVCFVQTVIIKSNNFIDVDDILSENYMPSNLLLLENPGKNEINFSISNSNTDAAFNGTFNEAMSAMDFHRNMMNEYLCRNFVAEQIVYDMSIPRFRKRLGVPVTSTVHPSKVASSITKDMMNDQGSLNYKDWLSKSATLEDIYRHFDADIQKREDDEDDDEEFDEKATGYAPHSPQLPNMPHKFRHSAPPYPYQGNHGGYGSGTGLGNTHGYESGYSIYAPAYEPGHSTYGNGPDIGGFSHIYGQTAYENGHRYVPKYHGSDDKGKDLTDLFDIALTALAFLSFGMFIVHVVMCITSINNNATTVATMMPMSMSPTGPEPTGMTGTGATGMTGTGGADMTGNDGMTGNGGVTGNGGMTGNEEDGEMNGNGGMTGVGNGGDMTGNGGTGGTSNGGDMTDNGGMTGNGVITGNGGMTGTGNGGGMTGIGSTGDDMNGNGGTTGNNGNVDGTGNGGDITGNGGMTGEGDGNNGMTGNGGDYEGDASMTDGDNGDVTGDGDNGGEGVDTTGDGGNDNTTGNTGGTATGTGRPGIRDDLIFRYKRNIPTVTNPDNIALNELARRILTSMEAALIAHSDDGACLRKTLCDNNKYSRSLNDDGKIWIPIWSLGMSWLSGRLSINTPAATSMLDSLKASVLGLGKANCEIIFQDCNLHNERMKRKRRKKRYSK